MTPQEVGAAVREALTDDLRRPPWRGSPCPLAGHCYVASEAAYHLLGGQASGWTPQFLTHEGSPHWYLRRGEEVLDITEAQFRTPVPHHLGTGKGFLTRTPSRRAALLMQALDLTTQTH